MRLNLQACRVYITLVYSCYAKAVGEWNWRNHLIIMCIPEPSDVTSLFTHDCLKRNCLWSFINSCCEDHKSDVADFGILIGYNLPQMCMGGDTKEFNQGYVSQCQFLTVLQKVSVVVTVSVHYTVVSNSSDNYT